MLTGEQAKAYIKEVKDFPKPGVDFKDISPLLLDNAGYRQALNSMVHPWLEAGITKVLGIESRGFIFGIGIADSLNVGFVPVRKAGKLPPHTFAQEYTLEYGTATIEVSTDAIQPGDRVLIHDDVLATGGTAEAAYQLVLKCGAETVGFSFLIGLNFLPGNARLASKGLTINTFINY